MKSNWPAWVADFRAYFDHPNSTEAYGDAERALNDAEEFLAFIERTPEEIAEQELEQKVAKIEEGLLTALAEEDTERQQRTGAELFFRLEEVVKDYKDHMTPEIMERVEQAGFRMLHVIFQVPVADIEANIHKLTEGNHA